MKIIPVLAFVVMAAIAPAAARPADDRDIEAVRRAVEAVGAAIKEQKAELAGIKRSADQAGNHIVEQTKQLVELRKALEELVRLGRDEARERQAVRQQLGELATALKALADRPSPKSPVHVTVGYPGSRFATGGPDHGPLCQGSCSATATRLCQEMGYKRGIATAEYSGRLLSYVCAD